MMSDSEQQLLLSLKTIVEGLLSSQVANVWNIYGGLNRLLRILEKILKHEFTVFKENGEEDCWIFVKRVANKESCVPPSLVTSDNFSIHSCTNRSSNSFTDSHNSSDPAMKWLRECIEHHKLSEALSDLLEDVDHISSCYSSRAFLRQPLYAQACLTCLTALELNQLSLLTDIHPSLYLSNRICNNNHNKVHRRCSSYPEKISKELNKSLSGNEVIKEIKDHTAPEQTVVEYGQSLRHRRTKSLVETDNKASFSKSFPCIKKKVKDECSIISTSLPNNSSCCSKIVKPVHRGSYSWRSLPCLSTNFEKPLPPPISYSPPFSPSILKIDYRPIGKPQRRNSINRCSGTGKPSLLEGGTESLAPVITGYFPRPCLGQSLTSFLNSHQFSFTRAELDRENAHFRVSEAIISAIEQVKWNKWEKLVEESIEDSDEEICELKQRIRIRRKQKLLERNFEPTILCSSSRGESMSPESSSSCRWTSDSLPSSSSSGDDEFEDMELDKVTPSNLKTMKLSGVTLSMGSLYSEADLLQRPIPKIENYNLDNSPNVQVDKEKQQTVKDKSESHILNEAQNTKPKNERKVSVEKSQMDINHMEEPIVTAEGVALSLLKKFSDKQLPKASDIDWLVSEKEAPQELLPLPESWSMDEMMPIIALRGTHQWAPPRPQIIFTVHNPVPRRVVMEKQKYMCGGCGMKVATEYAHRFRYCDYLGKYFCTGCHSNQHAIIPARVLFKWEFNMYPVSNFSFKLLEQMSRDPLFNLEDLNKILFKKVTALDKVRTYRRQLFFIKDFFVSCRFANSLYERFEKEDSYIFKEPNIYSVDLLVQIRTGRLTGRLSLLLKDSLAHISKCQLCIARGFVCELCHSEDIIFPWQLSKVHRCEKCGSCFHISCFNKSSSSPCPRCTRISARTIK